jgi:hypothetical protein
VQHQLTPAFFESLVDFAACNEQMRARLASLSTPEELLRFFVRYASWNGQFANGVAALTSLVGGERGLFVERGLPRAVADRSNFVASHFFDAARDEYDDHISPVRDSHRCLAQASLLGMAEALGLGHAILDEPESPQVAALNARVLAGYAGAGAAPQGRLAQVFCAMGYHLGSELLADREFSIIDEVLRARHADLVQRLMRTTIALADGEHRCYAWIGVHSGHGGGVEAEHFAFAVRGAQQALKYLDPEQHPFALASLGAGFAAFADDHRAFFEISPSS